MNRFRNDGSVLGIGVLAGLVLGLLAPAPAPAADAVDGVWTFSGGQVAIHAKPNGSREGVVIRATRFARCDHPVGELMWTTLVAQPDGSWHGRHQWYRGTQAAGDCRHSALGPTAWRIVTDAGGGRALKVCFGQAGQAQPTIAPDGTEADVTWGCVISEFIRPIPTGPLAVDAISNLPAAGSSASQRTSSSSSQGKPARRCRSRRNFRIRLRHPRGDALKSVVVLVNGKRVATRRGARVTAPIDLRNLGPGRYSVTIRATTVLGRKASETRRYRTCVSKSKSKKPKKPKPKRRP